MGRRGAESIGGAGLHVPSQGQGEEAARSSVNDMLSIRGQFQEEILERVRGRTGRFLKQGQLGGFWKRDALCRNERISANKLSHT